MSTTNQSPSQHTSTNQPSFATDFWNNTSPAIGLSPLYSKLHQGTLECDELLTVIKAKAAYEQEYGRKVYNMKHDHKPQMTGFGYDEAEDQMESSSLKNAFMGILGQISNEGQTHLRLSEDLTNSIVKPFDAWCKGHKTRVEDSRKLVLAKVKEWEKEKGKVEVLKGKYFDKWREFEEMKVGMTEEEIEQELSEEQEQEQADSESATDQDQDQQQEDKAESQKDIKLGPIDHTPQLLRETLQRMIQEIAQSDIKVTLLGTYKHTITGLQISTWVQENLNLSLSQCEEFGQSLLDNGLIRKINTSFRDGLSGSEFIGARGFICQWKSEAYVKAEIPDPFLIEAQELKLKQMAELKTTDNAMRLKMNQLVDGFKSTYLEERTLLKLSKDIKKLDSQYIDAVLQLDSLQCQLHELITENLQSLETYEKDRINAMKRVMLDYATIIRSSLNQLEESTAVILTYRESVNVLADLQLLISSYGSGQFKPSVVLYDNYHKLGKPRLQLFGSELVSVADLESSRNEGKGVPVIITSILQYLDEEVYPSLKDDKARVGVWLDSASLREQYQLRNAIQSKLRQETDLSTHSIIVSELKKAKPLTIASLLKLYLSSLPTSLIPQSQYSLLHSLYYQHTANTEQRHLGISSILRNSLPKQHYLTLRVLLRHFFRISGIIKDADKELYERFIKGLSLELGKVVMEREETGAGDSGSLAFKEKFMKELLTVKELTSGGGNASKALATDQSRSSSNVKAADSATDSKSLN
ncbi:hypothetical protein WICPIJ_008050 [Wickerhamomyces pijperi]|uniref:Rho-GAP domain-containing protein n=1 Tax=Wickerhamomyces pijperi TaxID=599730 RepID=A0A9P8Q0I2_WICPI|nr:hypothetical protein WICPIJ_008050 [Wickerhamomyces pijperi]